MSFGGWLLAVSIVILLIGLALGIGWWFRNSSLPDPNPNVYTPTSVWSTPVPSDNPDKNVCQLYTFPTQITPTGVGFPPSVIIPGVPTLNSNILDGLSGISGSSAVCIDSDQTSARQVTHTCIPPSIVGDNSGITLCRLVDGGTTGLGGSEIFYTPCPGKGLPLCAGQVSSVSVNFQAPRNPDIFCIQNNGPNITVSMEPCDPSTPSQLFRVTRVDLGQNPNALNPGEGQNGLIGQILDRNTGLCMVPGDVTISTTYDQSYLNPVGCSGGMMEQISGTNIMFSGCTGGQYPGYVWAFLSSLPYCPNPNGCTQSEFMATPPQIIYVGDMDLSSVPTGTTGYNGFTGSSALIQWLIDQGGQSLYYGGAGNNLILRDMGTNIADCTQKPFTSQYMNLTTFNILSQEEVCIQEGTFETLNCPVF